MSMFSSVLIANRGEIAVRIARTAKGLGMRTIAVYSEGDAGGLHTRVCDEAVLIGPAAPLGSYLAIAKLGAAARRVEARGRREQDVEAPRASRVRGFAGHQGNAILLHERDGSLQRRHQKVVEQAPAPGMTAALRAQMGAGAVAAARAAGYVGAGTVE